MDKYKIGPKNRLGIVIISILLLSIIFHQPLLSVYRNFTSSPKRLPKLSASDSQKSETYSELGSLSFPDYLTFGENNQYVAASDGVFAGKNYILSTKSKRLEQDFKTGYVRKKEYYKIAYQKIDKSSQKQILDLSQWVKENKEGYGIYRSITVTYYQESDYFLFVIGKLDNLKNVDYDEQSFQVLAVNLTTGNIDVAPSDIGLVKDSKTKPLYSSSYDYELSSPVVETSLRRFVDENLHYSVGSAIYSVTTNDLKPSTDINLLATYPELKAFMVEHNQNLSVSPRYGMVSSEEWFNDLLHWFAPVGQESLTVHTQFGNNSQADTIAIRSYADYEQAIAIATSEGHINPSDTAE